MPDHAPAAAPPQIYQPVAPAWHTFGVLALIASLSALSLFMRSGSSANVHRTSHYLLSIVSEWLITAFIWFQCRRQGRSLLGPMSWNWRSLLRDLGLVVVLLILSNFVLSVLPYFLHIQATEALRNMLPRTDAELAVFILLSLTAGICEEIIFRGYLQKQCTAWFESVTIAILLQGIVFGVGHAYQGPSMIFPLALYGFLLGWVAHWRRDLRVNISAHFLQDALAGALARTFLN